MVNNSELFDITTTKVPVALFFTTPIPVRAKLAAFRDLWFSQNKIIHHYMFPFLSQKS